jgi:hypothetical protein
MKKTLTFMVLMSVILTVSDGCKKKTNEVTCNLDTGVSQPPADMNLIYTATQSGDGVMASLTYETISGPVTIQNPKLPWSDTVPVLTTTNVKITATGTVKNGSLRISYNGASGGSSFHGTNNCEQSSD